MRTGIPPLALTALAGLAMWLAAKLVPACAFRMPHAAAVAIAIGLAGVTVGLLGVLPFRRARTTLDPTRPDRASSLVTSGIFRYTRNPMYLGMLLVLVAWGVYLSNAAGLLVVPTAFVVFVGRFQIAREERALLDAFGSAYSDYSSRVRRWL